MISILFALIFSSCGPNSEDAVEADPAGDCRSFCYAYADMMYRCGLEDHVEARIQAENSFNGSCDNVASVRNHDELHFSCIPAMATAPCSFVSSPEFQLDSTCMNQFKLKTQ
jgi:hypothetical protein